MQHNEQANGRQRMKRRGILAAAGAALAGLVAKQAADKTSVTADGAAWTMPYNSNAVNSSAPLVTLNNTGTGYGLYSVSASVHGVHGFSSSSYGVFGQTFAADNSQYAGVFGYSRGTGTYGVYGYGLVTGPNESGVGVYGFSTYNSGVYGVSTNSTGVYGQTSASNQYGVLGTTYAANSTAIAGTCTGNGSSAFSGGTLNPAAFAGFFQGTVVVHGNFAVTGAKSAVVQHPRTGDHRLLYCVESPEAWFEDFGEETLTGGHAEVKLDPDFTALIHTDGYHVFLTTYGAEGNGLNVTERTANEFVVQERNKGTGNRRFSWRVVAKRADVKGERLGKFVMPNLALPKPVEIPPQAPLPPKPAPPPKQ